MTGSYFAAVSLSVLNSIALLIIVALGLAVIFGMMGLINLAHGEFLMLGAYMTITYTRVGLSFWLAAPLAALSVGVFGLLIERSLIRFLYGRIAAAMLATWGLSLIMVQAVTLIFGTSTAGVGTPMGSMAIGPYSVSKYSLFIDVMAVLMLGFIYLIFTRTRYGVMARAATRHPEMAAAVGIDVRSVNMFTFALGAALAGLSGALLAPLVGVVPTFGQQYVGSAFMTVIVGGAGMLTGTASSALILGGVNGIVSSATSAFLGSLALLVVAIVLLRFMPTGISGRFRRTL